MPHLFSSSNRQKREKKVTERKRKRESTSIHDTLPLSPSHFEGSDSTVPLSFEKIAVRDCVVFFRKSKAASLVSGNPQFRLLAVENFDLVKRANREEKKKGQDGPASEVTCEKLTTGARKKGSGGKENGQHKGGPMTAGPKELPLREIDGVKKAVSEEDKKGIWKEG